MITRTLIATAIAFASFGAFAQTHAATTTQRDVNQQARIENGLKSGALTTKEAGKLEKEQAHVDRLQARSLKNGSLSPAERARLNTAQNKVSRDISVDKHNGVTGNPQSASSKRMQADVARNVNQQKRIEAGVKSGSLTNHEAARLEKGQAHVDAKEAQVARNGHVSGSEQASVQRSETRQSRQVYRQKHDAQVKG